MSSCTHTGRYTQARISKCGHVWLHTHGQILRRGVGRYDGPPKPCPTHLNPRWFSAEAGLCCGADTACGDLPGLTALSTAGCRDGAGGQAEERGGG